MATATPPGPRATPRRRLPPPGETPRTRRRRRPVAADVRTAKVLSYLHLPAPGLARVLDVRGGLTSRPVVLRRLRPRFQQEPYRADPPSDAVPLGAAGLTAFAVARAGFRHL